MARKLTLAQARACEEARGPVCRCRCGGALHGASHAAIFAYETATGLAYEADCYQLPLPGAQAAATDSGGISGDDTGGLMPEPSGS